MRWRNVKSMISESNNGEHEAPSPAQQAEYDSYPARGGNDAHQPIRGQCWLVTDQSEAAIVIITFPAHKQVSELSKNTINRSRSPGISGFHHIIIINLRSTSQQTSLSVREHWTQNIFSWYKLLLAILLIASAFRDIYCFDKKLENTGSVNVRSQSSGITHCGLTGQ